MIITRKAIPRRTVLRGLGASLALPLLDGMVPAFAGMQDSPANPVRRLGIVYVPNGMRMEHWTPSLEGAGFDFKLEFATGFLCEGGKRSFYRLADRLQVRRRLVRHAANLVAAPEIQARHVREFAHEVEVHFADFLPDRRITARTDM